MRLGIVVALLSSLASSAAVAQEASPRFSLVTGESVAAGADMVSGKFGWPGIEFGYQHGLNEKTDVGVVFDLLYSVEGTTTTQFGIALGVPLRLVPMRKDKISLMLHFTPGITVYTTSPAVFGFNFPIGGTLGVQVAPDVRIAVSADMIMKVAVTPRATFEFAPMFGPSVEYFIDRNFSISLDTRFGPVVSVAGTDDFGNSLSTTSFGFRTQVGLAYRLP